MLRRLFDLWLAPKTFTAAMLLFPLFGLGAAVALLSGGVWPLAAWGAILAVWWFEAASTVCVRCRHYGTWHCAGMGMLVSKVMRRRPPGVPRWRVIFHFSVDAVAFFFPIPWIYWRFGAAGVALALAYLVFIVVASVPKSGPSYQKRQIPV
jgi:hypothetical protein